LRKDEHFYPFQSPTRKNDECLIITQDTENIPYNSPLKQDEKSNPYESPPRQREECNNYESLSPLGKDVGFNAYHSPTSHDESPSRQNAESIPYNSPLRQDEQLNPYGSPPRQNEECNSYESPSPLRIFLEFNAYHSPSNHDESPSRQDAESILYNSPLRQDKKLNPYGSPPRHNEECNNYKSPSPLKADGQYSDVSDVEEDEDEDCNSYLSHLRKDEHFYPFQSPTRKNDECLIITQDTENIPYNSPLKQDEKSNPYESPPRQREECNNYESLSPLGKDVGFNAYHSPTSHDESPSRQNAESIPYNSPLRQDEQLNPYGSPPRQNEECNSYESPSPLRIFLEFNAYHSPSNHDESPSRQDAESILYNSPLRQDKKLNPYGSPPRHNEKCNNYKSPSPLKADGQFDYYQDKESNYHNSPFSKDEEFHPIQNPKEIHSLRSKKKTLPYSKTLGYVSNTFESRRKRIHDSTLNRPKNKYQKLDKQLSTPERIIKRRESVEVFEESNFEDIYDDIENNVSQTFQQESDECRRFSITTRRISLNFVYNENDRKVERYYQEDLETKKDKRLSPPEYYIQEDCQASTKERGSVLARLGKIESEKSGSVLSRLGKINSEMKVCSFFQMGKCAYGKNCYKLHESPNLREKTGRKKKKKKKSKAKSFNRKMLSRNNLLKLGTL